MKWSSLLGVAILFAGAESMAQGIGYWGQSPDGLRPQIPYGTLQPPAAAYGVAGRMGARGAGWQMQPQLAEAALPNYPTAPRYPVVSLPPLYKFLSRVGPSHSRIQPYFPKSGLSAVNSIVVHNSELQYYNIHPGY